MVPVGAYVVHVIDLPDDKPGKPKSRSKRSHRRRTPEPARADRDRNETVFD